MQKELEREFDLICKPIPTWGLSDGIGLDTETAYILDLTTEENFNIANEFLSEKCFEGFSPIDKRFIGDKVIMEYDANGGNNGDWYCIHGNIDEYFENARKTLEEYLT